MKIDFKLLKEKRDKYVELSQKINSHADAIRTAQTSVHLLEDELNGLHREENSSFENETIVVSNENNIETTFSTLIADSDFSFWFSIEQQGNRLGISRYVKLNLAELISLGSIIQEKLKAIKEEG